jgi:hypothetical protein
MRARIVAAAFLLLGLAVSAQERKYLFLNAPAGAGLDAEKRTIIAGRLTEAFYRTKRWSVMDEADIARLLEAQERALSGIFAESADWTAGGLIPADYAALCDVVRVGDSYTLTLRIRSLRDGALFGSSVIGPLSWSELQFRVADAVWEASSLGTRAAQPAASGRFSLTVDADAPAASVYIDGLLRGTTPLVVDGLEGSSHTLEVRKGAYSHREDLELKGNVSVRAKLRLETGGLVVKTDPPGAVIYIGRDSYPSGRLIGGIPAEEFVLSARLGSLVWRGPLHILPERTVEITLILKPGASLVVDSPAEAKNRLESVDTLEAFTGGKTAAGLYPGSYRLVSSLGGNTVVRDIELGYGDERTIRVEFPPPRTDGSSAEREAAIAGIQREIDGLPIPAEYAAAPVPDIRSDGIKTAALSLVPLYGFSLSAYPDPLILPDPVRGRLRTRARFQLGIGLFAQAAAAVGLVSAFASEPETARRAFAAAGSLAAFDLLYGFWGTAVDGRWYAEQARLKERKRELELERDALKKQK